MPEREFVHVSTAGVAQPSCTPRNGADSEHFVVQRGDDHAALRPVDATASKKCGSARRPAPWPTSGSIHREHPLSKTRRTAAPTQDRVEDTADSPSRPPSVPTAAPPVPARTQVPKSGQRQDRRPGFHLASQDAGNHMARSGNICLSREGSRPVCCEAWVATCLLAFWDPGRRRAIGCPSDLGWLWTDHVVCKARPAERGEVLLQICAPRTRAARTLTPSRQVARAQELVRPAAPPPAGY